jgi:hypothetical protein
MSERGRQIGSTHNGKLRIEYQNNRIIFDGNDGLAQLLIGLRSDGQLAVDAAPPGVDVLTAGDIDLAFSSRFKSFKIAEVGSVTIAPFNVPAHSSAVGSAQAVYDSQSMESPIVLAFTDSLPSNGLYLWQGISPESSLSAPTGPMGFDVFIRFDSYVVPGTVISGDPVPKVGLTFNATVRNATVSPINGITYDIKYYVLVETASA